MIFPQNAHDPGLLTLTLGHQEKGIQKSCVSFEEECNSHSIHVYKDKMYRNVPSETGKQGQSGRFEDGLGLRVLPLDSHVLRYFL